MQARLEVCRELYMDVRLLDADTVSSIHEGTRTDPSGPDICFACRNKNAFSRHCAAKLALATKSKACRLESCGTDIAHITAHYYEVEGRPYVLELVQRTPGRTTIDPEDSEALMSEASGYDVKLYHDSLTCAFNRRYYEDVVQGFEGPFGVAIMDLDDFKIYNDSCGHQAGDLALEVTAAVIRDCIRQTDILIRYGGDEFLLILPGCTSTGGSNAETIRVGVCAGPYQDMFEQAIEPSLTEQGYSVKYVEFSDYVQPNNALADGEIDLNLFQHATYLESFSKQHNLDLASIVEVPTAAMGVFLGKAGSLDQLPPNATVAIPNDDTNLSRALRVLQQAGLITLDASVDPAKAGVNNIAENPRGLSFQQVNAEVLPTVLDSVDVAVINGNYAIGAGLDLADAAYVEQLSEGYYNVIAVQGADADAEFAQAVKGIVQSDAFKSVIDDPDNIFAGFGKPSSY